MKEMLYNDLIISTTLINKVFVPSFNKNLFFAGTDNGIFLSQDNGRYFKYFINGLSATKSYDFAERNGNVFAGTDNGVFLLDHIQWKGAGLSGRNVYALINFGDTLFAGTDNSVFLLSRKEDKWEEMFTNISRVQAFSKFNGKLYAATPSGIFTLDEQWRKIFSTMALSIASKKSLYIGTYSGILKSIDGINFKETGLREGIVRSVSVGVLNLNSEIIYAGTDNGLLISTDNGKTFSEKRLNKVHIFTVLASEEDPHKVYVGTWGRGIITYYFKQTP